MLKILGGSSFRQSRKAITKRMHISNSSLNLETMNSEQMGSHNSVEKIVKKIIYQCIKNYFLNDGYLKHRFF